MEGEVVRHSTFGTLKVTVAVLLIQAILLVYQYSVHRYSTYPFFVAFDLILAYGVYRRSRIAVGVSLVYLGIDLFLAIMYLIAGVLLKGVIAFMDFLAIHDMVSYIGKAVKEKEEMELEEAGGRGEEP